MLCANCLGQIDFRDEHYRFMNRGDGYIKQIWYCDRRITDMKLLEAQAKVRRAFADAFSLYEYSVRDSTAYWAGGKEGKKLMEAGMQVRKDELLALLEDGLQMLTNEVTK